jgi:hypothetical protein
MLKLLLAACAMLFGATSANAVTYIATFSGAAENPFNTSTATGFGTLQVLGNSILVDITYSGLGSGLADGHIHCCTAPTGNAGVAIGFSGLTLGSTSGTIRQTLDLTQAGVFRNSFVTGSGPNGTGTIDLARARLFSELDLGRVYFNLHTTGFPGGEIRGNLVGAVPEPATWVMMIGGFGIVGMLARRRRAVRVISA